jgi:hypothetical protein
MEAKKRVVPSAWTKSSIALLQKAPTSTTKCQVCKQKIAQHAVRMGVMYANISGYMLMEWMHLACNPQLLQSFREISVVGGGFTPSQRLAFTGLLSPRPSCQEPILPAPEKGPSMDPPRPSLLI